ncbi:hypothetical protein NT6N_23810 [Oceaniferula spumae]|uniref:Uncharacterized protein n=1 Tax=Oceaniferula spumae TaxID=2979115 RepID=A0AAT9FMX3_9BACT
MTQPEKHYKISGEDIQELITNMGSCIATDRIVVDGVSIGYMYREVQMEMGILDGAS